MGWKGTLFMLRNTLGIMSLDISHRGLCIGEGVVSLPKFGLWRLLRARLALMRIEKGTKQTFGSIQLQGSSYKFIIHLLFFFLLGGSVTWEFGTYTSTPSLYNLFHGSSKEVFGASEWRTAAKFGEPCMFKDTSPQLNSAHVQWLPWWARCLLFPLSSVSSKMGTGGFHRFGGPPMFVGCKSSCSTGRPC